MSWIIYYFILVLTNLYFVKLNVPVSISTIAKREINYCIMYKWIKLFTQDKTFSTVVAAVSRWYF